MSEIHAHNGEKWELVGVFGPAEAETIMSAYEKANVDYKVVKR